MSSVTPLAAALIGAGGAVVGGVLTTSGQLILERSRARREQAAKREREAREVRLQLASSSKSRRVADLDRGGKEWRRILAWSSRAFDLNLE